MPIFDFPKSMDIEKWFSVLYKWPLCNRKTRRSWKNSVLILLILIKDFYLCPLDLLLCLLVPNSESFLPTSEWIISHFQLKHCYTTWYVSYNLRYFKFYHLRLQYKFSLNVILTIYKTRAIIIHAIMAKITNNAAKQVTWALQATHSTNIFQTFILCYNNPETLSVQVDLKF